MKSFSNFDLLNDYIDNSNYYALIELRNKKMIPSIYI